MRSNGKPLRIGYIAKMFPRLSETFVLNEILELERQGAEVTIFSARKPDEGRFHPQLSKLRGQIRYLEGMEGKGWAAWASENWEAVAPHSSRIWGLVDRSLADGQVRELEQIWMAARIAKIVEDERLDALHAHFATLPARLACLAHQICGVPFSFTAHAKDIFVYTPEQTGLLELLEHARFAITVTEFNREYLQSLVPENLHGKIRVLHNGIDLANFEFVDTDDRESGHLLAVSRLVPKKGFDDLLRALALLVARGCEIRCTLAGTGPMEMELDQLRTELGLESHVELTGAIDSGRVRELMRRATAFALPCKVADDRNMDALPTVLLEALASGLPAISTRVSGVPEIIEHEIDGLLVEPGDIPALADAVERLLGDGELRRRLSDRGRSKAETKFDIRKNVEILHRYQLEDTERASPSASEGGQFLYLCTDRGIRLGGRKGAAVHMREFLSAMARLGRRATVAVRGLDAAKSPSSATTVLQLGPVPQLGTDGGPADAELAEYLACPRFADQLDDEACRDGFEFIYERYSLFGTTGLELSRRWDLPLFVEVNAPLIEEASHHRRLVLDGLARDVATRVFERAAHVFVVSTALEEYVRQFAPNATVSVVPNGVDPQRFRSEKQPVNESGLRVGFVGRVRPWHGVEGLIDAVAIAAAGGAKLELSIVGECGELREELERRAGERGISDCVKFTGALDPEDIPAVLADMDVLAAPYPSSERFYFSPLKIYEYMAAGRAIVASRIGQIADVLIHEETALLVRPSDENDLAAALTRLAEDGELRRRLGSAARREAEVKHRWEDRLAEVERAIERHVGSKGLFVS